MSKQNNRFFEFDNFRADPQHKCLWFGSELVSLTPKSFDTLLVLIKNKGQVVDKDTLMDEVWGDTFVEEAALKQNISTLRKKFDSLQIGRQFIETIPRRGYRFVGEVREVFGEEEIYLVETRTKTHIIANQEIHLSDEKNSQSEVTSLPFLKTKNKSLVVIAFASLVLVSIASFFAWRFIFRPSPMSKSKFSQFEIKQITANGNVHKVAVSPDGKYLAIVEKKNDLQTVFLRQIDSSNNVEIIPPTKDDIIGITFSPESESIYYTSYPNRETKQEPRYGVLNKVPILGGTSTEVLRDIDSPVSISPDKRNYLFIRDKFKDRQSSIIIYDSAVPQNKERILTSRNIYDRFNKDSVVWSPDGKKVAAVAYNSQNITKPFQILVFDNITGQQEILANDSWSWVGQINWLSDGSGIVLTGFADSPNLTDEVWVISYPNGEIRKITNGINGFYGLGLSADSNSLVTVKSDRIAGILVGDKNNLQEATLIQKNISNGSHFRFGFNLTAEGKIVYSTSQLGNADIWMMDLDGSKQKQLTNDPKADLAPVISKDNHYIVFISNRSGTKNIWRMNFDGTNQTKLTDFEVTLSPTLMPDGQWIYFSASTGKVNKPTLWKIPIDGGQSQSVTNLLTLAPQISPDGKFIACFYPKDGLQENQNAPLKLTVLSAIDASIIKQFEIFYNESQIAWTSDSNAISYIEENNGESAIFLQPLNNGKPQKLYTSLNEKIFGHRWSSDGKNLVMEKGTIINDIVLIKNTVTD